MTSQGDPRPNDLLLEAAERASRYLEGLRERSVAPTQEALDGLKRLDEDLPLQPTDPHERPRPPRRGRLTGHRGHRRPTLLRLGHRRGLCRPPSRRPCWPRPGTSRPAWSPPHRPAPSSRRSRGAGCWSCSACRPAADVGFVTGATMANFAALAAARHAAAAAPGLGRRSRRALRRPARHGGRRRGGPPLPAQGPGLDRLRPRRVVTVPVDGQGRMRADALPRLSGPAIVCVQAGNVNTGAFDPLSAVIAHAREHEAWVHVDGAFGLWAAASPVTAPSRARASPRRLLGDRRPQVAQRALRQRPRLRARAAASCPWRCRSPPPTCRRAASASRADYTPELSRRARGVEVWAALRSLGRSGVADLVERCCRHAQRFAEGLRQAGYEILNDVVLNQVLVSFGDAETTRAGRSPRSSATARAGAARTVWQGHTAMRISVSSWATTDDDVERSLTAMVRLAEGVRRAT